MKIRILKSFAGYRAGQEFEWADGMARIYLGRGMVEEVRADASPVVEEAAVEEKVERAAMQYKRKPK